VMARGRLSPSIATADATVELIGEWMSGLWPGHEHTEQTEHTQTSSAQHAEA
jgi:hypothetical protein